MAGGVDGVAGNVKAMDGDTDTANVTIPAQNMAEIIVKELGMKKLIAQNVSLIYIIANTSVQKNLNLLRGTDAVVFMASDCR